MSYKKKFTVLACLLLPLGMSSVSANDTSGSIQAPVTSSLSICGDMRHTYGPFDYTNYNHFTTMLPVVELYHFSYQVESLQKGISDSILGDLTYTLLSFPNHHRALTSLSRFEFVVEDAQEQIERNFPIDCYYQNAISFKPDDGIVRLIYATYLHKKGLTDNNKKLISKAGTQYNVALQLMPNSPDVHYNLGLYYLDTDKLNLAVSHGHKAYELGFPLEGLKDKLKKRGVWDKTVSQY